MNLEECGRGRFNELEERAWLPCLGTGQSDYPTGQGQTSFFLLKKKKKKLAHICGFRNDWLKACPRIEGAHPMQIADFEGPHIHVA